MNYSLRVTRVKKSNRALLVFSVLTLILLAPLETFADAKIKPDFGINLITDNRWADLSPTTNLFYDAAVKSSPAAKIAGRDNNTLKRTMRLALADAALVGTKPSHVDKSDPAGLTPIKLHNSAADIMATEKLDSTVTDTSIGNVPIRQQAAGLNLAATVNTSSHLTPPASKIPAPTTNNKTRKELPAQSVKPPGPRYGPERFYKGYCTEYVARYYDHGRGLAWFDNAGAWLYRAQNAGWPTGMTPRVGAIMVTSEGGGHVALVKSVNYNNQTFDVTEQNFRGFGVISERTIHFGAGPIKGFIY